MKEDRHLIREAVTVIMEDSPASLIEEVVEYTSMKERFYEVKDKLMSELSWMEWASLGFRHEAVYSMVSLLMCSPREAFEAVQEFNDQRN